MYSIVAVMFIVLVGITIISFIIGKQIAESRLPKWLDFKPFNCRKCLTTWTSWVLNTLVGLMVGNWIYIVCGTISSTVIFCLIHNEEKKQWM